MPSARKIGDRVALLYGGHIIYEAPPAEFLEADDPSVRQFVQGQARGPLTAESDRLRSVHAEGA
jgi:phospholipid/cholesterol/gamma-HCH transport system ATP-binding protein